MSYRAQQAPDDAVRQLSVVNAAGEDVPAFALMRVVGVDADGSLLVNQPDADGQTDVLVNSPVPIPPGAHGQGHAASPAAALYDDADGLPLGGEAWGAAAGSWKLRKGKAGALVVGGSDPAARLTNVLHLWGLAPAGAATPPATGVEHVTASGALTDYAFGAGKGTLVRDDDGTGAGPTAVLYSILGGVDGRTVRVHNEQPAAPGGGSATGGLYLARDDGVHGTPSARILVPHGLALYEVTDGSGVDLVYDGAVERWRVVENASYASESYPGLVSTTTQGFAGFKVFDSVQTDGTLTPKVVSWLHSLYAPPAGHTLQMYEAGGVAQGSNGVHITSSLVTGAEGFSVECGGGVASVRACVYSTEAAVTDVAFAVHVGGTVHAGQTTTFAGGTFTGGILTGGSLSVPGSSLTGTINGGSY